MSRSAVGRPQGARRARVAPFAPDGIHELHRRFIRDAHEHAWEPGAAVRAALAGHPGRSDHSELAWQLASGSSYAEQVGMDVAAGLLHACPDADMKLVLATAVADEAKHSTVFHDYARAVAGSVRGPSETADELSRDLWSLDDHTARFLAHTLAEGLAADEFHWFVKGLRTEGLGDLYRRVRRDESRHVALGMSYLTHGAGRDRLRRMPAGLLLASERIVLRNSNVDGLGSLIHRLVPEVAAARAADWLRARHETRMRVLTDTRDDREELSRRRALTP